MIDRARAISLLPAFWHEAAAIEGSPTSALIDEMVAMLRPIERQIDTFDTVLDPHRAPDGMLPFLAAMAGLGSLLPHWRGAAAGDFARLRAILICWPVLRQHRGESAALARALELILGAAPAIDERSSFHISIVLPKANADQIPLATAITNLMKPAHLTHDIAFRDAPP